MQFESTNILRQAEIAAEEKERKDVESYFLDFTKDIERPIPIIYDPTDPEKLIVTEQNLFCIAGEAKSYKSFLASLLTIDFFTQHPDKRCILIDTEQAEWNVANVAKRICRGMGWDYKETYESQRLRIANLRPYSREERLDAVERIINQEQPYLCIIDGVRDLVESVNDDVQCMELINKLMKWTEIYKCAIGTIIHCNKDGETLRGHLGSELLAKCETTLFCKPRLGGGGACVSSMKSRNISIEPFELSVGTGYVPYRVNKAEKKVTEDYAGTPKEKDTLEKLPMKETSRVGWVNEIRSISHVTDSTARKYFDNFVFSGHLVQTDKAGNKFIHFKLISNTPVPPRAIEEPEEIKLDDV